MTADGRRDAFHIPRQAADKAALHGGEHAAGVVVRKRILVGDGAGLEGVGLTSTTGANSRDGRGRPSYGAVGERAVLAVEHSSGQVVDEGDGFTELIGLEDRSTGRVIGDGGEPAVCVAGVLACNLLKLWRAARPNRPAAETDPAVASPKKQPKPACLSYEDGLLVLGKGEKATKLKLMQFKTSPGARVDNTFIHSSYGFRYLTLSVKDVNAAVARAEKAGAKPIAKCPVPLPEGLPAGLALANYRDPDGNLVELVGPWKP